MKWPEVCYFLLLICSTSSDLYSSVVGTEKLLQTEISYIQIFHTFIMKFEQRIVELKRQVEMLEREHKKVIEDRSNPLNSFILIKRLLNEWDIMLNYLSDDLYQEANQNITELKSSLNFPKYEDLTGAVEAINRISDIYNIDKASLAKGKIIGTQYSSQLSADDCYEMVKQSYVLQQFHHVYSWANEALKRFDKEGNIKDSVLEELLELKGYSAYRLDDIPTAFNTTNELLKLFPSNPRAPASMEYYTYVLTFEAEKITKPTKMDITTGYFKERKLPWDEPYKKICRKEISPSVKTISRLKCRYINNDVPFLRLAPLKEEEAYLNPRIVRYKDVLYDSEIEILKEMAIPKLQSALVKPYNQKEGIISNARIAQGAGLADDEHHVISTIIQRTEDITKLEVTTAEPLSVVNYGIGGHYIPHWDYFRDSNSTELVSEVGDRIATLLFYLNDVNQGGVTAFPLLRLGLKPEKGTAVLWFNLSPDGKTERKTLHASCPIMAGTKWIATKWFREKGQEFRRPCDLKH